MPPRRLLLASMLFAVALTVAACGGPAWQDFTDHQGGYRVRMRGDPLVEKHEVQTPIGKIVGHWQSVERGNAVFGVGYADYPVEFVRAVPPHELFATVRDGWVKRIEGRLQGDGTELKLDKQFPGLEFVAAGRFKGRDAYLRGRLYLVGTRLYQVVVFGDRETLPRSDITEFVGSFKLTDRHAVNRVDLEVGREKKPPPWESKAAPATPPAPAAK